MSEIDSTPVLACRHLSKTFHDGIADVEVLKEVDLTVQRGECIAIIGASGSGKSTLLHLLGGLEPTIAGHIWVAGRDITQADDKERSHIRSRYLGFIYQFHHLLPEFTVLENACIPLLLQGAKPRRAEAEALVLLKKVGLLSRRAHRIQELSGGERQRTAIVRALITKPHCVLADEPTGNLDNRTAEQVYQTLRELNQLYNTSLVIVTHEHNIAQRMDRVLRLENGHLLPAG